MYLQMDEAPGLFLESKIYQLLYVQCNSSFCLGIIIS